MRFITETAVLAQIITGCGSTSPAADETPATTSAASASLASAQRYQTVAALKDAAVAAGLPCSAWTQGNVARTAAESGNCAEGTVL